MGCKPEPPVLAGPDKEEGVGVSQHPWGNHLHFGNLRGFGLKSVPAIAAVLVLSVQLDSTYGLPWASVGEGARDGASQTPLRDPEYVALVGEGFEQLYNLDYERAIATFTDGRTKYPAHPGPPLVVAAAIWLRELFERQELNLNRFVAPGYFNRSSARKMPGTHRQAFFENIERSQQLSAAILEEDVENEDARFFRGSAEALLAAFSYTIDRSKLGAIGHAKKAYRDHQRLLAENPEYYDAYMSVGLYEYIIDNLRWYFKWPAKIVGYRGSEERGIEYLELARDKGLAVPDEARVLLMVVYFREKQNRDALASASELHRRFPRNFLFHLNQGQILERMRRKQEAVRIYLAVVRLAEEQRANYYRLPLETFRYKLGSRFVRLGRPDVALPQFVDCTEDVKTPAREQALCHLGAGLLLDKKGSRERARSQYDAVLGLPRVGDSHKKARRYLKRPYRGS